MAFDLSVIFDYWPQFLEGAALTVRIVAIALVGGIVLAAVITAASFIKFAPLKVLIMVYLAIVRGIPFIIIVFLVHYGLPFAGVRLPALTTGTIALTLFASAYYAEVLRATVLALPRGQWDSARAVGMSPAEAVRHVIIPQILRPALPPLTNYTMTMTKESSVLSAITVGELTYQGLVVQGNTFAPFEVFFAVAGIYWIITGLIARATLAMERKLGEEENAPGTLSPLARKYLVLDRRET
ncbi:MAG: amino acid ABC transporter permease [Pseudomonadota bacterium]